MIYLLVLFPATALTIGGYVALFLSARCEGAMRSFGKYLGFWAFTLAALLILGAIFAAAHGRHRCPFFGLHGMHERMYGPASDLGPPAGAPRASQSPGTTPNPADAPAASPPTPHS
jgi:hypothetical protein